MRPDLHEVFAPRQQKTEVQNIQQQKSVSEEEEGTMSQGDGGDSRPTNVDDSCSLTESDRERSGSDGRPHSDDTMQHSTDNQRNGIKVSTRS